MNKEFFNKLKNADKKPDLVFIITDQERATQNFPDNWESENLKTLTTDQHKKLFWQVLKK